MNFNTQQETAIQLDKKDPLAKFRQQFYIPQRNNQPEIYLSGNSLGLQPKKTAEYINLELKNWQQLGVRGHFEGEYPWMPYHEFLTKPMSALIGAKPSETIMMNSLTVNLHLMMVSFYRPTNKRHKILIESKAFPSDRYAVESQIKFHGFTPEQALISVTGDSKEYLAFDTIKTVIEKQHDEIALILLPGVQYYSGQVLPIAEITALAHQYNIVVGFDLAHAAGNLPLELNSWQVDFAVWCSYKYLNGGAGSVGGCYINEKYINDATLPRFAGWWGSNKNTRFDMAPQFDAINSAEGWQLSNPPILSLAAIRAALDVFIEAGGMEPLRQKSLLLTAYLQFMLQNLLGDKINILTPNNPAERGCQLSFKVNLQQQAGETIYQLLLQHNIACDWRHPNVIRVAPVPLYNSFVDVYNFVKILDEIINNAKL